MFEKPNEEWALFVILTQDMNKRMQYLVEGIAKDIIAYPLHISKYYTCNLGEMQPGQPGGSDWSWTTPYPGRFAVRLKVEGDGAIENPQFTTPEGVIKFPCTVKEHQYLLYTFDGKAVVTDKNYNVVQTVVPEGEALMPAGTSAVSFSCSLISEDAPDVVIRFMTLGEPETVEVR